MMDEFGRSMAAIARNVHISESTVAKICRNRG